MKNDLRDFILSEMKQREMSARKFAEFVDVSNDTINRALDERDTSQPSTDFLVKLSDKTNTDISTVFALAFPEVAQRTRISARALLLAQRLERLPKSVQDFILSSVVSSEAFGKAD